MATGAAVCPVRGVRCAFRQRYLFLCSWDLACCRRTLKDGLRVSGPSRGKPQPQPKPSSSCVTSGALVGATVVRFGNVHEPSARMPEALCRETGALGPQDAQTSHATPRIALARKMASMSDNATSFTAVFMLPLLTHAPQYIVDRCRHVLNEVAVS
jgi:hypothetical protein